MDPSQKVPDTPLIERFAMITITGHSGVFQALNKFIYPNVPLSGSSFGTIPEFAFPDSAAVFAKHDTKLKHHYFFALTKGPGTHQFAVCRRLYSDKHPFPCVICIISSFPWFELIESILEKIEKKFSTHVFTLSMLPEIIPFLDSLIAIRPNNLALPLISLRWVPPPGSTISGDISLHYELPNDTGAFGKISLELFSKCLTAARILAVWAALVCERRVIVHSTNVNKLTHFVLGIVSLLYPLEWPHIFIPILCESGLDYCAAPMPFLIGIHSSLVEEVNKRPLEEITWVDLDEGTVTSDKSDYKIIPPSAISALTNAIESERSKSSVRRHQTKGTSIRNAFTSFWLSILAKGYSFIVKPQLTQGHIFLDEAFIASSVSTSAPFLTSLCKSQMFAQFIHEKQDILDKELPWTKLFDQAATRLNRVASATAFHSYLQSVSIDGIEVLLGAAPAAPNTAVTFIPIPNSTVSNLINKEPVVSSSPNQMIILEDYTRNSPKLSNIRASRPESIDSASSSATASTSSQPSRWAGASPSGVRSASISTPSSSFDSADAVREPVRSNSTSAWRFTNSRLSGAGEGIDSTPPITTDSSNSTPTSTIESGPPSFTSIFIQNSSGNPANSS